MLKMTICLMAMMTMAMTMTACAVDDVDEEQRGEAVQALGDPAFAVSVNPTSVSVPKGGSAQVTVTASSVDGFAGDVSWTISLGATRQSAAFLPTIVHVDGTVTQASSTLTISAQNNAQLGTTIATISGFSPPPTTGWGVHSIPLTVTVVH